ncbi:MAG: hypothetical protein ABR549_14390 [Mycobacteriales bacterium]
MPDYPPLFVLKQAMWSLHEDWRLDFADAYAALGDWFEADGVHRDPLNAVIRDIDQLFAEEPDAAARLAHFPHLGWRVETFDDFLRAIRKRAADGLAGSPDPMHAPAEG